MPLHLLKLCVGLFHFQDLHDWIEENRILHNRLKRTYEHTYTTRMVPKRADEIIAGGSLDRVISGQVSCRQRLLDIRPFTDPDGIGRCHSALDPVAHSVEPRPFRPFQGWRYLDAQDAPRDIGQDGGDVGQMPEALRGNADLSLI